MILYLIDFLKYDQKEAFAINAVLITLFELGSIFGGILADRLLGFRRALIIGSALLTVGYSSLIVSKALIFSFGLMIMGGNLMVSNIPALVGQITSQDTKRQQKYMTLLYAMQNLGALISIPLLGYLKEVYGFSAAFAVAGVVMGLGGLALVLSAIENKPTMKNYKAALSGFISMPILAILLLYNPSYITWGLGGLGLTLGIFFSGKIFMTELVKREKRTEFFLVIIALIFFFAINDQSATSLILYADKMTNSTVFGLKLPATIVGMVNPLTILALASWISKKKPRLIYPFLVSSVAMFGLSMIALMIGNKTPSVLWVTAVVGILSICELFIGPLVFQKAAEASHEERRGEVMGVVPIAFCLAFLCSGLIGSYTVDKNNILKSDTFAHGFQIMSCFLLVGALIMALAKFFMRRKSDFDVVS